MNIIKKISITFLSVAIILGGVFTPTQAFAATAFPSETNAFTGTVYIGATDVDKPFFDEILPEIRANIAENNTHTVTPYYDAFPRANNPENFQSLGHTTYANINGKTVTADAFFRYSDEALSDPNVGLGLLVYQCIEYKRAHPEEDVKITYSSYRTSASAAVCVIPESKYYGYMRSLFTTNYDEQGFVRVAFMLVEAARMGIEVTLVNHLNSYSKNQYYPSTGKTKWIAPLDMKKYFSNALKTSCYDKYAKGKKVSNFMNCTNVDWLVDDKTADMQHVKSATVSHYLATDGTEHGKSVFLSSSNFDDIDYKGCNANNGAQTGTIISDHDEVYRVVYNYMQLMTRYKGQEGIYKLRRIVNKMNNEQIALIKSGRENEIPRDEQIVYLGSETDTVFEMYFTPFGGSADTWDIEKNPFCKYINKLPQSTDYVELYWNEFGYGKCQIGVVFEKMLEQAYCRNANVRNKISMRVTGFDTSEIEKLKLGREIGASSINDGTNIHSKDILLSYEENGVRHNVSLVTSCNFYMIAFNYRTNSLMVINETEESGGNYYDIMAEKYSYEMVNNDLIIDPQNLALTVGETYTPTIKYSGNKQLTWSIDNPNVASIDNGTITALQKGSAVITVSDGELSTTLALKVDDCLDCIYSNGLTGNINEQYILSNKLGVKPMTFRVVFQVNKNDLKSVNTLISCDDSYSEALSIYINAEGRLCIMVRDKAGYSNKKVYVVSDQVKVATGKEVDLLVSYVRNSKYINVYVNGEWKARPSSVACFAPEVEKYNYSIGGDYYNGNPNCFPGIIKEVTIWSNQKGGTFSKDVYDNGVDYNDPELIAAYNLDRCTECLKSDLSSNNNDLERVVLWQDKDEVEPVGDYDYSFAVIGDTQSMCEDDPKSMESIYDWLVDNKDTQNIKYVMGLGDITDDSTDTEWGYATEFISKLNGKIPYSLTRGNHDDWDDFNRLLHNGYYENTIDGFMNSGEVDLTDPNQPGLIETTLEDGSIGYITREEDEPEGGIVTGDLTNSYRYLSVGGVDYLILTLDFAPTEEMLQWVDSVVEAHPNHRVIITTHAYMYRDGTTISSEDCYPPSYYSGYDNAQNGDEMWDKCFSKHKNIVMVLSGHDPWQHIVYRQDQGVNGNTVTQMLIDPQYMDRNIGSTAMVAMLCFSNNSNTVTVRYYSVAKDCYGSALSQFTIDLGVMPNTDNQTDNQNSNDSANQENILNLDGTSNNSMAQLTMQIPAFAGNINTVVTNAKPVTTKVEVKATNKLTASATKTTVTLKWSKVSNASGYKIYKYNSKTKKYEYLKSTSKTQLKVSKLKTGTTYKFRVRAYNKDILGDYSSAVSVTTKLSTPKLKAKSSSKGKVTFSWSNVTGETGYQVYYKTSKTGKYKKLSSYKANVLKGSKSKLKSKKTYYFKVRAYKKLSNKTVYSSWSSVKKITIK